MTDTSSTSMPKVGYPPLAGYRRSVLVMFLGGEDSNTPLEIGGTNYALKKLQRWRAEGPTERNKQMARFILNHGHLGLGWSHTLTEEASLLIDLALEWGDFSIWKAVLKKSAGNGNVPQLSSDVLVRAWGAFTFDRIKSTFVRSTCADSPPHHSSILLFGAPAESR